MRKLTIYSFLFSINKSKLKVKENYIKVISDSIIIVQPPPNSKSSTYHVLQNLKEQLPKVVIKVGTSLFFIIYFENDFYLFCVCRDCRQ